jgi:cell division septum initiation protein DivIVA
MTERPERPEFATAIRGYDRLQVDDYIARLAEISADAEERARAAEEELEFSRHTTVGPRVGQMLELAVEEAKELRQKVNAEAEAKRSTARSEASEIISRANEEARETRKQTEAERQQALADLETERRRAHAEIDRLERAKHMLLGDLRRLQEALAAAAAVVEPDAREAPENDAHDAEPGAPKRKTAGARAQASRRAA